MSVTKYSLLSTKTISSPYLQCQVTRLTRYYLGKCQAGQLARAAYNTVIEKLPNALPRDGLGVDGLAMVGLAGG